MESNFISSEDMWTPFKELQNIIEVSISSNDVTVLDTLERTLLKYKQNFLTILKNPPKNATSREDLMKGIKDGIKLPGIGHQILPKELVDEAIIISDMYDLNEFMALDLLGTAQHQLPYHPGLTRGLVAVLLYYDGRKALVTSLRILVQARKGILWTVEGNEEIAEFITNYTTELMQDGLILKLLSTLESLDLSKEMEILQVNRALGGPRHHHQVVDLFQNIRQGLADIIYLWAAQSGLPKDPTIELINVLQRTTIQEDSSGGIDSVTLALQMALIYAVDLSVLHRIENVDDVIGTLPLLAETGFIVQLQKEIIPEKNWKCKGLQGLTHLAFAVTLATLRTAPVSLHPPGLFDDDDDILLDCALQECNVFSFLTNCFLLNESIYKEEFYLRKLHTLLADFIILMPLKVKELRNKAEEAAKTIHANIQEGLDPPSGLPHNFEHLLLAIAKLYSDDPLNLKLELEYWCPPEGVQSSSYSYKSPPRQVSLFKFVRQSGDILPATLFVPYMKMLASLASSKEGARQAFSLLKYNQQSTNWDHFFDSLNRYYSNLRQELPVATDTIYRRIYHKGITPQEIQGLQAVLGVIRTVAEHDDTSRLALCENPAWAPLSLLLGLVTCSIQINLKAELLLTLAALAKSPDTAAILWHNLEASQILATVPNTSSYQPRGIQTELEELESRNEEYPLTRAMLRLLDVLTDGPVPRLLGVGNRIPGFDPYLNYILHSVLLKFNSRSYKNQQEKWEVCRSCLHLLVKYLNQYEPQPEDFGKTVVQVPGDGTSVVSPPPGFHIMNQMCFKSELLRLILLLIDEGCQMLDTYTVFSGKANLEASTLLCLQLVEAALGLQQRFLATCSAANSNVILIGVNKLLNGVNYRTGKPDHLLNITKYVTYNNWLPAHALSAINILRAVTSYPIHQSHLVSIFTSTASLTTHIRHGFVECLEADNEEISEDVDNLGVVTRTKEAICKLLLQCLNHNPPNISHYLLGFDLNKDVKKTMFQQPGVLGFPRTCLHSLLVLLNTSLRSRTELTSPVVNHTIVELAYRLIYALAANIRTSEPTLRFLRSSGEFLQRHLAALPFRSNNTASDLIQTSWLLKTVAIELKVTSRNQQISQLTALVKLLVAYVPSEGISPERTLNLNSSFSQVFTSQLSSSFADKSGAQSPRKQVIFSLLSDLPFLVEPVPQPVWKFFVPAQLEKVIHQCDSRSSTGLKMIDIKRLHRNLMVELSTIQGSTAGQRAQLLEEIQNVLTYAVKNNIQRRKASATVQYLDAWRQTSEILFAVAPTESLPFHIRLSLLLELIHELLKKVLAHNVLKDLALITSDAILILFVNLRNCYTYEYDRIKSLKKSGSGDSEDGSMLTSLLQAKENVLKKIITAILKWILSSVGSQKLRANLYSSLLNFLRLSRQQREQNSEIEESTNASSYVSLLDNKSSILQPAWVSKHSSLEVLAGFGERLVTVLCHDSSGGHDICKMLALSCLDMMVELDSNGLWVSFLSTRGYLKFIVDSLLDSDSQLMEVISPMLTSLRPLYVYESKMALLCRVAATEIGAKLLLEQNCLSCLSAMQVFDNHPDIVPTMSGQEVLMELDFIPCVSTRYLQIMSPALSLCETVLSSLGVENESAVVQVLHFLLSHGDTVSQVLRSGSPFLKLSYLKELAQLTGVIARATNQKIVNKINDECYDSGLLLESTSHFHRIQKLMLLLLSRFVISETLIKDVMNTIDVDIRESKNRAETILSIMQISANLVMYVRNLIASSGLDKRVTSVVLQPVLLDSVIPDRRDVGLSREASLGVVVQQLVQCVNHYHREKDALNLLLRRYSSIRDMNTTSIKELLPEDYNRFCPLEECKQHAAKIIKQDIENKKQEVDLCCFIIEHCLYLLWSHLDFYMFRAIPNKTLGISKPIGTGRTSQMAEITWNATIDEINILKQGLLSVFNDTFCKNLVGTTQDQKPINKGFVEALLRRIKKLMQFVPNK